MPAAQPSTSARLLQATELSKSYGGNVVLDSVSLGIDAGESVVLLGENGAGKSTLAKIVAGVTAPSSGSLSLAGKALRMRSPHDAIAAGVGFIPQELSYVPELSAAENIAMGRWPARFGFTTAAAMRRRAKRALDDFGIELDLERRMERLTVAERQIVEIVKALVRDVRVLVLDEPTAALSERESMLLVDSLRRLQRAGVALLVVLHRLDQAELIADRAVVLRNGRQVETVGRSEFDRDRIVAAMLGDEARAAERSLERRARRPSERTALRVEGLCTRGEPHLDNLSVEVKAGEVVGVFGPRGAGAELLGPLLGGVRRPHAGSIVVAGSRFDRFKTPGQARRAGVAFLPPERKREGVAFGISVTSNVCLMRPRGCSRLGFLRPRTETALAREMASRLGIRSASLQQDVAELSGGNQQKVLLASRLLAHPSVLILDHPTRGVDVGARAQIHAQLRSLAEEGLALLLISTDVEEAVVLADRVLVLRGGRLAGELEGAALTQEGVLQIASGAA